MISVFGSAIDENEVQRVSAVLRSQWMGFGAEVELFEKKFADRRGFDEFVMLDSGSNALFMAVKLLDLDVGSEIIIPSFTWVSCAQAVLMAGCIPIFCDVNPHSMNVTAEHIAAKITPKTGAVMVVHYAGLAVEMDAVMALGFPVIEDTAHAVVSSYNGKPCGGIGTVGIFSFDAVKNLAVGEGGGLVANSAEMMKRARHLRYCGIGKSGFQAATNISSAKQRWWEYQIDEPFIKMLPTNIAGAIGLSQLEKLESMQMRRKEIWDYYTSAFSSLPAVKTPMEALEGDDHSYFTYAIQIDKRDELAYFLLDQGIYTTLRYHPLHLNPLYGQTNVKLPHSERLNEQALSIPLHPRLLDSEIEKICDAIGEFCKRI